MKKILRVLLLVLILSPLSSQASQGGPLGLGLIFGEPTGFTGKYWLDHRSAFDFGISYSLKDYVFVYGDYLYHFPEAIKEPEQFWKELSLYAGVGMGLSLGRASSIFLIRIPLGAEWRPIDSPIGVFLELAPGIRVSPSTIGDFAGGIGVRYYF